MTAQAMFRVDAKTGLQYHRDAEWLMKANAVAGVVFLLIGGVLALLVALTRWPAVHLLNAEWFYLTLTAHGIDMLIFWIIFFEIAVLYFCSSTLLRCRLATPRIAWLGFALMVVGMRESATFNAHGHGAAPIWALPCHPRIGGVSRSVGRLDGGKL